MYAIFLALACLAASPEKPVYNYLLFTGPNGETAAEWQEKLSKRAGMQKCYWLFHNDLFPKHLDGGYDNSGWIDEAKVLRRIRAIPKGSTVIINLENGSYQEGFWNPLSVGGMTTNPEGILHRTELLQFIKKHAPFSRYGYFGQIPRTGELGLCGDYRNIELGRSWAIDWRPMVAEADFLVPSIYTDSDWSEEFCKRYIAASIIYCRDYYPGKKVYPILWMCHYDLIRKAAADDDFSKKRLRACTVPYWKTMLETAHSLGDGVVLWGGFGFAWTGGKWWRDTKEFTKCR